MYVQGAQALSIEIREFVQWAFSLAISFKYFVRKNSQGGGVKNGTIDGYAYYTCYFRAGFT